MIAFPVDQLPVPHNESRGLAVQDKRWLVSLFALAFDDPTLIAGGRYTDGQRLNHDSQSLNWAISCAPRDLNPKPAD